MSPAQLLTYIEDRAGALEAGDRANLHLQGGAQVSAKRRVIAVKSVV
jgi:hypothetical protein